LPSIRESMTSFDYASLTGICGSIWAFMLAHPIIVAILLIIGGLILTLIWMIWMNQKVTAWSILKWFMIIAFAFIGILFFYANKSGTLDVGGFLGRLLI